MVVVFREVVPQLILATKAKGPICNVADVAAKLKGLFRNWGNGLRVSGNCAPQTFNRLVAGIIQIACFERPRILLVP